MVDKRIYLSPLEKEHIETVRQWRNDPDIRKYFFSSHFINKLQQDEWFERYSRDNSQVSFAILNKDDNKIIGTIGLSKIDHYHQRAEMGTMIGDKNSWGKGVGSEATNLIVEYAFNNLNLQKVYCYIADDNIGSIKKNEKVGFKKEGNLRKHAFINGTFKDVTMMAILKEDYLTE
ncbi:MAG: UDP-4-amino-4,6-dideoxy-N-acetyl-beta-L-altrosamine N-acetyltransferase [Tissierella sp.]|uniref:UDP-4-amino-4, 6-dideoxy-N-acetyl-beta-L-altrosamine N-acetyltransferase n=1 Tax=Tissierella sp. TaxID=41274 RepID=UPI003F99103C